MGSKLRFQTAIVVAMMHKDWGAGKTDPRFLARTLGGNELEELPWRWGAGQGGQGLSTGHAGQSSLGTLVAGAWGQGWARRVAEQLAWALDDTPSSSRATMSTPST